MPTHEADSAFLRDFRRLSASQRAQFLQARTWLIADLHEMEAGRRQWFRAGLVRKLRGTRNLYELRWARDGRATFSIGSEQRPGLIHIEWRRCGTHDILP